MSNYELNKGDNFVFAFDISLSMKTPDCPGGLSRIEYLKEQAVQFAREAGKYDEDGLDVITFGAGARVTPGASVEDTIAAIQGLKATDGMTDTASAIQLGWKQAQDYVARGGTEQTVLFIATDGEPSDRLAVINVLRDIASQLDKDTKEFSVSFLTVGAIDAGLREFLTELDDNLKATDKNGNPIDFVDVKQLADVDFMTAFIGAVHD